MTTIPDENLYTYSDRVKGSVVLITGAAAGIGRMTALQFAQHGAKVVIGDLNVQGGKDVVQQITQDGGHAVFLQIDVLNWDDQVALFELAMKVFGSVDVVVVNAGVSAKTSFEVVQLTDDGIPVKPSMKALEINLVAAMYTTHLALHYLKKNQAEGSLKAISLLGSMASWLGISGGALYSASKHGILGLARSLTPFCIQNGIRISIIHPWFADTNIIPPKFKIALIGLPLVPVEKIAGTIFYSVTEPDPKTNGSVWALLDDGPVLRLEKETLTAGVYGVLNERAKRSERYLSTARTLIAFCCYMKKQLMVLSLPPILIFAAVLYYQPNWVSHVMAGGRPK